jgi:hypothetical protein
MRAVVVVLLLIAFACAPAASSPPASDPHVRGEITRVSASEVTVEEIPGESRGAKAVVTVTDATVIESRSGRRLRAGDLRQGQTVGVWFDGEVMQSYPLQGKASRIVVE